MPLPHSSDDKWIAAKDHIRPQNEGHILIINTRSSEDTDLPEYLEQAGFLISEAEFIDHIYDNNRSLSETFDLIILIASLPSPSTLTAIRHLHRIEAPPIFVVAAQGEPLERVLILEMGADDLVGPEANAREILARLHRILSRKSERPRSAAAETAWTLRHAQRMLIAPGGQRISLTGRDHALLIAFCEHADAVLMESEFPPGQMRTAISRLKRKVLIDAEIVLPIENVWGQGYRFDAPLMQA